MREQVDRLRSVPEVRDLSAFSSPRNWMVNAAVRHALQTSVEALIDIAFHVVAKRLNTAPRNAYDAFRRLAGAGLIPDALLPRINRMIGFRNRLVHRYMEVDDARIVAIVHDDLDEFETVLRALETAADQSRQAPSATDP